MADKSVLLSVTRLEFRFPLLADSWRLQVHTYIDMMCAHTVRTEAKCTYTL